MKISQISLVSIVLILVASSCTTGNFSSIDDDMYFSKKDIVKKPDTISETDEFTNKSDNTEELEDKNYMQDDYYYSSRISRFHRPYSNFGYFSPAYTNAYWYGGGWGYYSAFPIYSSPYYSMYLGFGNFYPSYYYNSYGWNRPFYSPWYSNNYWYGTPYTNYSNNYNSFNNNDNKVYGVRGSRSTVTDNNSGSSSYNRSSNSSSIDTKRNSFNLDSRGNTNQSIIPLNNQTINRSNYMNQNSGTTHPRSSGTTKTTTRSGGRR